MAASRVPETAVIGSGTIPLPTSARPKVAKFPCPYCKGDYKWVEPVLDDGSGPTYTCGFCDDGMIVVGSEKHMEIKSNNPPKEFMWELIGELGVAVDQTIAAIEKLPDDARDEWQDILKVCKNAKEFHYEPDKYANK